MAEDNWIHRSEEMAQTCMFFVPKKPSDSGKTLGRCRCKAPTLKGWPAMFSDDWCGDHKLDENKI